MISYLAPQPAGAGQSRALQRCGIRPSAWRGPGGFVKRAAPPAAIGGWGDRPPRATILERGGLSARHADRRSPRPASASAHRGLQERSLSPLRCGGW